MPCGGPASFLGKRLKTYTATLSVNRQPKSDKIRWERAKARVQEITRPLAGPFAKTVSAWASRYDGGFHFDRRPGFCAGQEAFLAGAPAAKFTS